MTRGMLLLQLPQFGKEAIDICRRGPLRHAGFRQKHSVDRELQRDPAGNGQGEKLVTVAAVTLADVVRVVAGALADRTGDGRGFGHFDSLIPPFSEVATV
jgi:hypothetical protein